MKAGQSTPQISPDLTRADATVEQFMQFEEEGRAIVEPPHQPVGIGFDQVENCFVLLHVLADLGEEGVVAIPVHRIGECERGEL
jgi:hypothetical protein